MSEVQDRLDTIGRPAQTEDWLDIFLQGQNGNEFHIYPTANHTIENDDPCPGHWEGETYGEATADWLQAIIDGD